MQIGNLKIYPLGREFWWFVFQLGYITYVIIIPLEV